jgi:hypothetical protein
MPTDVPAAAAAADYQKNPGLLDLAMRLLLGEQNVFEISDKKTIEFFRDLTKNQPP